MYDNNIPKKKRLSSKNTRKSNPFDPPPFPIQAKPENTAAQPTLEELKAQYFLQKKSSEARNSNISFGPQEPWIKPVENKHELTHVEQQNDSNVVQSKFLSASSNLIQRVDTPRAKETNTRTFPGPKSPPPTRPLPPTPTAPSSDSSSSSQVPNERRQSIPSEPPALIDGIHRPRRDAFDETREDATFSELNINPDRGLMEPAYWQDLDWEQEGSYEVAPLPRGHRIFRLIENYISQGIEQKPYNSPKQEGPRMQQAREILENPDSTDLMRHKAQLRLREGEGGGAERISSGPIEITRILVIRNPDLWQNFIETKERLAEELADDQNPMERITWSTQQSPVVDQSVGESFLLHGTSPEIIDMIAQGGFRPDLGRNRGTEQKPKYGLLGQGAYFADTMSKTMTYAKCPHCLDYRCSCTNEDGEAPENEVLFTRSLLGRSKRMYGFLRPGGNLRGQDHETIKDNRHSVYSQGWNVSWNPLTSGSGANEFLVKNAEQLYPEFRIYCRHQRD